MTLKKILTDFKEGEGREGGERQREHQFVVLLLDAFIGCSLRVP